jgi:hypothetical protein
MILDTDSPYNVKPDARHASEGRRNFSLSFLNVGCTSGTRSEGQNPPCGTHGNKNGGFEPRLMRLGSAYGAAPFISQQ